MKFLGACNDEKANLDRCFKIEKEAAKKKNVEKMQSFDAFKRFVEEEKSKENKPSVSSVESK